MVTFLIKLILLSSATTMVLKLLQVPLSISILFAISFAAWFILGIALSLMMSNISTYEEESPKFSTSQCLIAGGFWGIIFAILILGLIALGPTKNCCVDNMLIFLSATPIAEHPNLYGHGPWLPIIAFIAWWALIIGILTLTLNRKYVGVLISAIILGGLFYTHSLAANASHVNNLKSSLQSLQLAPKSG